MKKKKLTAQQVKLIINLISLLIFLVSYLYVFNSLENKTEAAKKEIDTINSEMSVNKKKLKEETVISEKMEKVKKEKEAIIDSFPVQIAKEDNFIFVTNLEEALHIHFSSIDMTDSAPIYQTILPAYSNTKDTNDTSSDTLQTEDTAVSDHTQTEDTAVSDHTQTADTLASDTTQTTDATASDATASNNSQTVNETTSNAENSDSLLDNKSAEAASKDVKASQNNMIGMQTTITLNFKTSYKNFKKLVNYIKNLPDRTMIESASISYDNTTGGLTGNIMVKRFSLTGTGKVYEPPYIKDINIGTDNIFGTGKKKK